MWASCWKIPPSSTIVDSMLCMVFARSCRYSVSPCNMSWPCWEGWNQCNHNTYISKDSYLIELFVNLYLHSLIFWNFSNTCMPSIDMIVSPELALASSSIAFAAPNRTLPEWKPLTADWGKPKIANTYLLLYSIRDLYSLGRSQKQILLKQWNDLLVVTADWENCCCLDLDSFRFSVRTSRT